FFTLSLVSPQDCGLNTQQVNKTNRQKHNLLWVVLKSHCFMVSLCLFSVGPKEFRLVGTDSRCAGELRCSGRLEVKSNNSWSSVCEDDFDLLDAEVVCRELDCGAPSVLQGALYGEAEAPILTREFLCEGHESVLLDCGSSWRKTKACPPDKAVGLTCSDSVRLENGSSRCSGRLEVKSNNSWSSVCEDDFDLLDAEVVCRELDCGAPSVLQGALYGEAEAPILTREFLCEGHESVLLDCGSSWRKTKACPPDKAVGLTCSDPASVRLMGSSRCSGELQVKSGREWRAVDAWGFLRTETTFTNLCKNQKCGSHVSLTTKQLAREKPVFQINSLCFHKFPLNMEECVYEDTMSNSVRLENGSSRCSGRLEVKSNNSWSSVCEDDFDLLDAEVVCRELGCGAPSVLQRALYGEAEAPILTREFLCEGHESVLLDCGSSWRKTKACPPDKAVGLTCSGEAANSVRLENGSSRCSGRLEVKSNNSWFSVCEDDFDLLDAEVVCRELGCGAPSVLQGALYGEAEAPILTREFLCEGHESVLLDCGSSWRKTKACPPDKAVGLTCSGERRWMGFPPTPGAGIGPSLALGRGGTTLLGPPVALGVIRFGCGVWGVVGWGVLSALPCGGAFWGRGGGHYWYGAGGVDGSGSPLRPSAVSPAGRLPRSRRGLTRALLGPAFGGGGLDSVRLENGSSRCSGRLEVKSNNSWSSVCEDDFDLLDAEVVCRELGCGAPSVLQGAPYAESEAPKWNKEFLCEGHESALLDCNHARPERSCLADKVVDLTCSGIIRLEGDVSHCAGTLEMFYGGEWGPVADSNWSRDSASAVCAQLGCGSALSSRSKDNFLNRSVWWIQPPCGLSLEGCNIMQWDYFSKKNFKFLKTQISNMTQQKSSVSVSVVGLMIRWFVVSVGLMAMILVTCFYATVMNTQIQDQKFLIVTVNCCLLDRQKTRRRTREEPRRS
uniref:SRCR domain-containing protein n=1 Tax=Oryzias latipes TaxID=8090 RepID=A0A3P9JJK6_ORYLA